MTAARLVLGLGLVMFATACSQLLDLDSYSDRQSANDDGGGGSNPSGSCTGKGDESCTCQIGGTCNETCPGGKCTYDCAAGSTCNIDCAGGGCRVNCEPGADCAINGCSDCNVQCQSGAQCH